MTTSIAPYPRFRAFTSTGAPLVGGLLYSYYPGTTTPMATYKNSSGSSVNTNPVVLDSNGEADIWLSGFTKLVLTDSLGTQIWSVDNVSSQYAYTGAAPAWIARLLAGLTYVSATQFTCTGNQTALFPIGMRIQASVLAGTLTGTITVSAYTSLTTITVSWDSGALDAGLSQIFTALVATTTPTPSMIPQYDANKNINANAVNLTDAITPAYTLQIISLSPSVTLSANRSIALDSQDANRTITLTGSPSLGTITISPVTTGFTASGGTSSKTLTVTNNATVDQSVNTASTPSFNGITLTGPFTNSSAAMATPTVPGIMTLGNTAFTDVLGGVGFQNSWVNVDTSLFDSAGFMLDNSGIVHLRGSVKSGTSIATVIFTLPMGYRPQKLCAFAVTSNDAFGEVWVYANGDVKVIIGTTSTVSLTGITFSIY